jgi:hypothetical protein
MGKKLETFFFPPHPPLVEETNERVKYWKISFLLFHLIHENQEQQ